MIFPYLSSLVCISGPNSEPLVLQDVKDFLHVSSSDDDTYIQSLMRLARMRVEDSARRATISSQWLLTLSDWPRSPSHSGYQLHKRTVNLERFPLVSVDSILYWPADGSAQTVLDTTVYGVSTGSIPGMLFLKQSQFWPCVYQRPDAIQVTFTAGYDTAGEIDDTVLQVMRFLIANFYENRTPVIAETRVTPAELPQNLRDLMLSIRVGDNTLDGV